MPLDNTLNVSELLRRLGVKGDSQGSATLLESLRLNLLIGDLSDLVPPVGVPFGAASLTSTSGVGTFNKFSLQARSAGGLIVRSLKHISGNVDIFITQTPVFGAAVANAQFNFAFGQAVQSIFARHVPAASVAPVDAFQINPTNFSMGSTFDNWVGPGEFLNFEDTTGNQTQRLILSWKEYPAALNPG